MIEKQQVQIVLQLNILNINLANEKCITLSLNLFDLFNLFL
jgi:hypothetical protein